METKYTFDENCLSDLHKEAHGYRPREAFWYVWKTADSDRKQQIWDELLEDLEVENARYEAAQQAAIVAVEARIAEILSLVAGASRADAIRFLDDAYNCGDDRCFLEFKLGVPYGYLGGNLPGFLSKSHQI